MKVVQLTRNKQALVSDCDFDRVNEFHWDAVLGQGDVWYAVRYEQRHGRCYTIRMHRFVLGFSTGDPDIDHRDRNGLNNQRENLRISNHRYNKQNSVGSRNRKCGSFKGTRRTQDGTWRAVITVNGKRKTLSGFSSEADAAAAYDAMAVSYFGDFARSNGVVPVTVNRRVHPRYRTVCPKGHPYSQDNTYLNNGRRVCRICARNAQTAYRVRKGTAILTRKT